MARILIVSYITELLQARERVLQSAGYEVTAAQSLAAATNAIQQQVYDAAVLGFGVPEEQRSSLPASSSEKIPPSRS